MMSDFNFNFNLFCVHLGYGVMTFWIWNLSIQKYVYKYYTWC